MACGMFSELALPSQSEALHYWGKNFRRHSHLKFRLSPIHLPTLRPSE